MRSSLTVLATALVLFGCDPADPDPTDAGGGDAGPRTDGGGTDSGDTDSGGAPDDGGDRPDAGFDAGPTVPRPSMEVRLDRPLVERDNERLTVLTVTCVPRDEDGLRMADPGDLLAEVAAVSVGAAPPTRTGPFTFTFPSRGSYSVTCSSSALGLSGSEPVEVAYEGIDRDVVRLAESASTIGAAIDRGLEAARAGDEARVRAAGAELGSAASGIDSARFAGDVELLVPFGWPSAAAARAAGLGAGADDAAWMSGLAEASAASAALRGALAALPTTGELTPAHEAAYASASGRFVRAVGALDALHPSPAAALDTLPTLDGLVSTEVPGAVREGGVYFQNAFATASVPPPSMGGLTLIGALVSIGIQHIVSNYSYTALLKKVGRVILENFIQMAIAGLIDELIPPDLGAPEIDLACGASCSFIAPGNPWYISGSLWTDPDPTQYRVIFIHPNVPGLLVDIAGLFTSARDVLDGEHWIQIAKNIYDIIKSIRDVAATTYSITDPSRVVLQPIDVAPGSPDIIEMGVLPTNVNCSFLPRAGTFIPVRMDVGRGPSYLANITQEGC